MTRDACLLAAAVLTCLWLVTFIAPAPAIGHNWLSLSAEVVENKIVATAKAEKVLVDGLWELHHKPPAILGGGQITFHCSGQYRGTVGASASDLVSEVLELSGGNGSEIHCEVSSSTNGFCSAGETVTVKAVNLPWATELLSEGPTVYDHVFQDGKGSPGYETTCKSISTSCTALDRAKWDENEVEGALFLLLGELTASCSDGGTGTWLGHYVTLEAYVTTGTPHLWGNLSGRAVMDGLWTLHHKLPAILGGGEVAIHCEGEYRGAVGSGAKDLVLGILEVSDGGDGVEIQCEVSSSTNSTCPAREVIKVKAVDLPWATELLSEGPNIYDHIFEDGKGAPGYEITCKSIKMSCTGLDRAKFDENEEGGALLLLLGELAVQCSDGGTGTWLGHYLALDFFVS